MKKLELRWVSYPKRGECLDFVVSGRSLYKELRRRGYDVVPRLWGSRLVPVDAETRDLLLLEREGDTRSGRVALYVCRMGGIGDGAVSARITREGADILWSEFAWETDCEDHFQALEKLGPYRFREAEYRKSILTPPERGSARRQG